MTAAKQVRERKPD